MLGDGCPFADPPWYAAGFNSPYYKETHRRYAQAVRRFVDTEVTPFVGEWDEQKRIPKEVLKRCAEAQLLPAVIGRWYPEYSGNAGPDDFDHFHELIALDELARCGSGGALWGLVEGLMIGLPPVLNFGSKFLQDKVAGPCLRGEKVVCLCITEPYAGSDVASLRCTAKKSSCGKFYVVSGEKKWITNGVFADFFTVAVRTGGKGAGGISMLLLERGMEGIETKQMQCQGVWASGTTYITFDEVKVPVENLIGEENQGFKYIMYNFNHERWGFIAQANRLARVCLEESFRYAHKRRTFGKRLIDHPVIRAKIGEMARQVEATHAMLETLTYQMCTMSKEEQNAKLGGVTALQKVQSTKVFEFCAREAAQIFGGASYVRGGQGEKVERMYRDVRAYAIPGGSEEIMIDFGVRQANKQWEAMQSKL